MEQEDKNLSSHIINGESLLSRFSALVEQAQTLAFPMLPQGITATPNMTNWSSLRRIAFVVSSPLLTSFKITSWSPIILPIWIIISLAWVLAANLAIHDILGIQSPIVTQSGQTASWEQTITAIFVLIFATALIPAAYWRWVEFFRDSRYPGRLRLILTLIFILCILGSPFWLLDPRYYTQFLNGFRDRNILMWLTLVYILLLIPCGTFWCMFTVDALAWGRWLLRMMAIYIMDPKN